jgi:hypothetical protein
MIFLRNGRVAYLKALGIELASRGKDRVIGSSGHRIIGSSDYDRAFSEIPSGSEGSIQSSKLRPREFGQTHFCPVPRFIVAI